MIHGNRKFEKMTEKRSRKKAEKEVQKSGKKWRKKQRKSEKKCVKESADLANNSLSSGSETNCPRLATNSVEHGTRAVGEVEATLLPQLSVAPFGVEP